MNENINLCEILKGHEGETFYSPAYGHVCLSTVIQGGPIIVSAPGYSSISMKPNGTLPFSTGECMLFPSKDQRDWNKWAEEQKPKVPKTWSQIRTVRGLCTKILGCKSDIFGTYDGTEKDTPIEKSALALLKIHQLIEVGYGGNVNKEEWRDYSNSFYTIAYDNEDDKYVVITAVYYKSHIVFHTKEQAKEFLKYPENVQLLRNYFMI